MEVRQLIDLLKRFEPTAAVRLCVGQPGRVVQTFENVWVGDYGGGPQINAWPDIRTFSIFVGCGMEQIVGQVPELAVDLGSYTSREEADKVRDFYVIHRGLDIPLKYPGFDYEQWIPPRTRSGQYNRHVADILREKLLRD